MWLIISTFLFGLMYAIIMILFLRGWKNLKTLKIGEPVEDAKISVIIALRNEADNIKPLIKSLNNQNIAQTNHEIILVNDHSSDDSLNSLEQLTKNHPQYKILSLPEALSGKKQALRFGYENSTGDVLLFTDADCLPGSSWIKMMLNAIITHNYDLILGPVLLSPAKTVFQKIQQLDYMSMLMSGAGALGIGIPILAFGPNMAIRRNLYGKLIGEIKENIPSGDDMFILEAAKRDPEIRIGFVKDEKAIICSPPPAGIHEFWNQRKRWVSKTGNYTDKEIIIVSIIVYMMNLSLFTSLFAALFFSYPIWPFLVLIAAKSAFEFPLLSHGALFFGIKNYIGRFVFTQIFYFIYIVLILPAGLIGSFKWKNR